MGKTNVATSHFCSEDFYQRVPSKTIHQEEQELEQARELFPRERCWDDSKKVI